MSPVYYKLTDASGKTRGGCQWGPGVAHTATGTGFELCSDGWIHCYDDPLLAIFMNPIHAAFEVPRLWEFVVPDGTGTLEDRGLKRGVKEGTTTRELPLPTLTTAQRVRAAILAVCEVYSDPGWLAWATRWLSGEDRTAAEAAAWAAWAAWAAEAAAGRLDVVRLIHQAIEHEPALTR